VEGAEFVMRASSVEYHAPARFDDLLECFVRVSRLGRTSTTYECVAVRLPGDELMVTATQTVVLVDLATRRPVPIPEEARGPIRAFEGDALTE
jgi:acyl-CoA thioester hydrolase